MRQRADVGEGFRYGRVMKFFGWIVALLVLGLGLLVLFAWTEARSDPVVRRMTVRLPHWPAGAAPVRVALLSDIHIGSSATTPARLARVVAQVDALRPDLILIAGDFVAGGDPGDGRRYAAMLRRPLAGLRAPLGTVAVLGNHDHWTDAGLIRRTLQDTGIHVLDNDAIERGPIAVVGIGDAFTDHADVSAAFAAAAPLPGARVVLTHMPDWKAMPPPGGASLVLAGHTHCGQAVLPLIGPVVINSPRLDRALYDPRYRCGAVRDKDRLVIVTAGIGASLPLRIGAPPDLWLLTLGP